MMEIGTGSDGYIQVDTGWLLFIYIAVWTAMQDIEGGKGVLLQGH